MAAIVECLVAIALALGAWRVARRPARDSLVASAWLIVALVVARCAALAAFVLARRSSLNLVAAPLAALIAGGAVWVVAAALRWRRRRPVVPATGRRAVAAGLCAVGWLALHVATLALALNAIALSSIGARRAIVDGTLLGRRLLIEPSTAGDRRGALVSALGLDPFAANLAAASDLIALPARTRARLAATQPMLIRLATLPSVAAAVGDPALLALVARVDRWSPTALWALGEHPKVLAVAADPAVRAAIADLDLVALRDAALALTDDPDDAVALDWWWAPLATTLALDATLADPANWQPAAATFAWPDAITRIVARAALDVDGDDVELSVRTAARATLLIDDAAVGGRSGRWTIRRGQHRLLLLLDGERAAHTVAIGATRRER